MSTRRVLARRAPFCAVGRRTVAAALLAGLLLAPAAAHAHKCDRTDNDRREASRVIADLTGEIDAMERAIIEALRLQTGQLSGYIAQSAKAVTGALDSQTKLQAQTAREVAETGSMLAHRPSRSACEAVTGLRGLAGTGAAAKSAHARASATETGRITGDRGVVDRPGAAAGDAARFETVTRRNTATPRGSGATWRSPARVSPARVSAGARTRCTAPTCKCRDALRPAHLRKRGGAARGRRALAQPGRCRWCTTRRRWPRPTPTGSGAGCCWRARPMPATALAADYLAQARVRTGAGGSAGRLGGGDRARGAGRDPETPVSRYELLELLASGRFEDPDWFVGLQAMSAENLLRELVTLQAVSLMLDWQRYRTDERRGAIDAASLALSVEDMRRLPGLANPAAGAN